MNQEQEYIIESQFKPVIINTSYDKLEIVQRLILKELEDRFNKRDFK